MELKNVRKIGKLIEKKKKENITSEVGEGGKGVKLNDKERKIGGGGGETRRKKGGKEEMRSEERKGGRRR